MNSSHKFQSLIKIRHPPNCERSKNGRARPLKNELIMQSSHGVGTVARIVRLVNGRVDPAVRAVSVNSPVVYVCNTNSGVNRDPDQLTVGMKSDIIPRSSDNFPIGGGVVGYEVKAHH